MPLSLLQGWIEAVASDQPDDARCSRRIASLLAGHADEVALAFGVAAGLIAVLTLWAVRGLRNAERAG